MVYHLRSAQDFVNVGDNIEAVVLKSRQRIKKNVTRMKQLSEDPWTELQRNSLLDQSIKDQ
ncbi:MAG: hypothetical protein CM15mP102_05300 [Flavobacteriales bacterium]|nr:MAG: hypothetical protein CM15mP102_05300 [Flavobacteriales bacterium]